MSSIIGLQPMQNITLPSLRFHQWIWTSLQPHHLHYEYSFLRQKNRISSAPKQKFRQSLIEDLLAYPSTNISIPFHFLHNFWIIVQNISFNTQTNTTTKQTYALSFMKWMVSVNHCMLHLNTVRTFPGTDNHSIPFYIYALHIIYQNSIHILLMILDSITYR